MKLMGSTGKHEEVGKRRRISDMLVTAVCLGFTTLTSFSRYTFLSSSVLYSVKNCFVSLWVAETSRAAR